ncbi:uncharacterized protein LOC133334351, partial [Musca vetustissima]|uniref:uncharacterized protein LOC133334351 n=1 Tax=Musca vetustissima TaxID=27455 RepID=UPI002AB7470E
MDLDMQKETIVKVVTTLLMESSSSESDDDDEVFFQAILIREDKLFHDVLHITKKNKRNAVKKYIECIVPTYTEEEFRRHFRVSKSLFKSLCQRLSNWDMYKKMRPDKKFSEETNILVFLWFAGHEACSYRDIADRFDLSLFTVGAIISRISLFLSSMSPEVIKWPTKEEKRRSAQCFDNKCFFKKAIGCIDGTHIVIDPPSSGKDDYVDRKGDVTLCLQGICNQEKKFINIFVGYPGSCHDSWVFRNSPIGGKLSTYCEGN